RQLSADSEPAALRTGLPPGAGHGGRVQAVRGGLARGTETQTQPDENPRPERTLRAKGSASPAEHATIGSWLADYLRLSKGGFAYFWRSHLDPVSNHHISGRGPE